jgi:hypothetical protein
LPRDGEKKVIKVLLEIFQVAKINNWMKPRKADDGLVISQLQARSLTPQALA